jgi:NAD(P)-dependent dehydrogenase (short-subunit alcohol dehydrogenase family)
MPTVLITGANRGLGLELARRYAAADWQVLACCRNPSAALELTYVAEACADNVRVLRLDVRDHAAIATLAAELGAQSIDLLLNNAGVYGPTRMVVGHIDYAAWADVLAVNTMAPMRLVECFVEHVTRSQRKLIACLSSAMGSIGGNTSGRHYLYRSSKAALNAVVKSLAIDLHDRGITVVALHPGWVKTDMGGADADLEVPVSVQHVMSVLDRLTLDDSGKFLNHDGSAIPW